MRIPRTLVPVVTAVVLAACAGGPEASTDTTVSGLPIPSNPSAPDTTTEQSVATDVTAEDEDTGGDETTTTGVVVASTTLPTNPPTSTVAPPANTAPGPGSSGCLATSGDIVTIVLTDPMPGPDFCREIRQSQSLEVINSTPVAHVLAIYQGSDDNLFETPTLAPGDRFASEAVGDAFPTGEWTIEVTDLDGWIGTLWVVTD